jgi:hypothetical protein
MAQPNLENIANGLATISTEIPVLASIPVASVANLMEQFQQTLQGLQQSQ